MLFETGLPVRWYLPPEDVRFDALAPEITWYDLKESLAPQEVGRSAWITALTAAGAEALPPEVVAASVQGVATGMWPDGTVPGTTDMNAFFKKNGPAWHVAQGRRLDEAGISAVVEGLAFEELHDAEEAPVSGEAELTELMGRPAYEELVRHCEAHLRSRSALALHPPDPL